VHENQEKKNHKQPSKHGYLNGTAEGANAPRGINKGDPTDPGLCRMFNRHPRKPQLEAEISGTSQRPKQRMSDGNQCSLKNASELP